MTFDYSALYALPGGYWLAVSMLMGLFAEAGIRWQQKWAFPAMMVYITVFGWYILEPVNSPVIMAFFSEEEISEAFFSVSIFLVSFRVACTLLTKMIAPRVIKRIEVQDLPAERVFKFAIVLWLILLSFGVYRLDGDLFLALFPIEGRAGNSMWLRAAGAEAGTFGFAVSTAGYLYALVLSLFGMLLPLMRRRSFQLLCIIIILIAWPYAFLQGSRSTTLAVFMPLIFSYLFFSQARILFKSAALIASAIFIEWAMRMIIIYRNIGFDSQDKVRDQGHLGLNMTSELLHCINFIKTGMLREGMGRGLLAELGNVIPRIIWPGKPLVGIDYAIARGYGGGSSDIGVFATVSTGMIGQGVLEFGPIFGPVAMALVLALWSAFLARLWSQGTVPRLCLFLVGIGLTFNLGRDVSMLVLWPMVFGYFAVTLLERRGRKPIERAAFANIDVVSSQPEAPRHSEGGDQIRSAGQRGLGSARKRKYAPQSAADLAKSGGGRPPPDSYEPPKTPGPHARTALEIMLLEGRYVPYVIVSTTDATLLEDLDKNALTVEGAATPIAARAAAKQAKGKQAKGKKKAKAPAQKSAAKTRAVTKAPSKAPGRAQ